MNCIECGSSVDLKAGDEVTPEIGRLSGEYGEVELCRACFSKGWSPATNADILADPELRGKVDIISPIQQEDL